MPDNFKFLRKLYRDINSGFSFIASKSVYLKHPNEIDLAKSEDVYDEAYNKAISLKLPTEEEKQKELIQNDLWSKKQEEEISLLGYDIENLIKRKSKLFIRSQIEKFNKDLKEKEDKLLILQKEKDTLLELTAEKYANKKINEFIIMNSFFHDSTLKDKIKLENFDYAEEIIEWFTIYNDIITNFNRENIKKIAIHPMFLNNFILFEKDAYRFYGKPLVELSTFQIEICSYGKYYANIFSVPEADSLDENIKSDPDALSDWYKAFINFKYNKKGSNPSGKGMSFVMGANQKDVNYLNTNENKSKDLNKIAEARGGTLNIGQLANI